MKKPMYIVMFLFSACVTDSINLARIVNDREREIELQVFYDKPYLESLRIPSYDRFLHQQAERARSFVVSIDTVARRITYKLPKGASMDFIKDSGPKPDFRTIRSVAIQYSGKIEEYSREMILQAVKDEGRYWVWHIK